MARADINAHIAGYKADDKKIFLQIDGLPHAMLIEALEKNYMPTLKKLLKKGYHIYEVYSELPSNTPAAQMKIMYGVNGLIRAFRWYNKKTKEHYTFKTPKTAAFWEEEASKRSKGGIMRDGAGYINLYSGDASRAIMTLSKALDTNIKKRLKSNEVWKLIFLNADFITILLYRLGKEFFVELYEYLKYKITKRPQRDESFFPYVRLGNSVFFRDISVMGAYLEMNEACPRIYITFMAYDELGHQRGPWTKEALKTLRGIDRAVRRIYKRGKLKGYDVFIFSDHGQTPSVPFEDLFGYTLKEFIKQSSAPGSDVESYGMSQENSEFMMFYFLKKSFKGVAALGSRFFNGFAKVIKMMFVLGKNKIENQHEGDEDIIVANSGPISHIYFNEKKERMTFEEIEHFHPGLADKILSHQGVEFGIMKTINGYIVLGRNGKINSDDNMNVAQSERKVFLNINMEEHEIMSSLKDIVCGEDSGDIVIFGAMLDENKIVNFEKQYGAHGGIGGAQNNPFLMTKTEIINPKLKISDLYDIFSETKKEL